MPRKPFQTAAKRTLDVAGAVGLGLLLSPAIAFTALAVKQQLGGSIIFKQERLGVKAKPFTMYKFRTMHPSPDEYEKPAERTTRMTDRLRRWHLDELPQLWNVIKGDMSLIGPRPLPKEVDPRRHVRHDMRPGITGLQQVELPNNCSHLDRLVLDTEYVQTWSIWKDIKIAVKTIPTIWSGRNYRAPESLSQARANGRTLS